MEMDSLLSCETDASPPPLDVAALFDWSPDPSAIHLSVSEGSDISDVCWVLAHYLQNWPRCFDTFRRRTEMESFIRPVWGDLWNCRSMTRIHTRLITRQKSQRHTHTHTHTDRHTHTDTHTHTHTHTSLAFKPFLLICSDRKRSQTDE